MITEFNKEMEKKGLKGEPTFEVNKDLHNKHLGDIHDAMVTLHQSVQKRETSTSKCNTGFVTYTDIVCNMICNVTSTIRYDKRLEPSSPHAILLYTGDSITALEDLDEGLKHAIDYGWGDYTHARPLILKGYSYALENLMTAITFAFIDSKKHHIGSDDDLLKAMHAEVKAIYNVVRKQKIYSL